MAQFFAKQHIDTDLIISSPAKRALETARMFAMALDYSEKRIVIGQEIYEASYIQLLNVLKTLDDAYTKVACFGHNPSITELSNYLTSDLIDNVPTCGIVHLNLHTSRWTNINVHGADLCAFDYPKKCL